MIAIVCIKQVPETPNQVEWDASTQTLDIGRATKVLNPFDQFAVEEAIKMREQDGGKVIILAMGPERTKEAMRECLAMGADEAYLLDDPAFQGADGRATARTLVAAIRKIGDFDVVFCGKRAIDSETAQVAARLAQMFSVPLVNLVTRVDTWDFGARSVTLERALDSGREMVKAKLPLVVAAEKDMNKPRYPSLISIRKASKKEIPSWTLADLGLSADEVGMAGSAVHVDDIEMPPPRAAGQVWSGEVNEAVGQLVDSLLNEKIVQ